uniref:NADH-ubiquinone oxidoreductase chain 5 n=1 Tax=Amphisbaena schmidti TaxID=273519 RepID=Q66SU8_AMPSC|nr:NADH dehydrogenase subunit 5 [Amphisbaena schmidti]AAT08526.1 NADH dehydrogenase subunit 5 [Amphisbaena schmidti]
MNALFLTSSSIILPLLSLPTIKLLLPPHTITTTTIVATVKLAFYISLIPLLIAYNTGLEHMTISMTWYSFTNFQLSLDLMQDTYTLTFTPVALFITWAIMDFSQWYMIHDPKIIKFFKYLLVFLLAMITLISTNNLLQLFIGWEGVGIMSFLLISWWAARTDANTAALQAIIYNRIGDMGLLITLAWLATTTTSWNLQEIFYLDPKNNLTPTLGLILAAAGKSAQFGLHPWLPAAMEGPTPVSALLHSSTMVVAGIFLLLRTYPFMQNNEYAHTICLCLGGLTSLFASVCALTQNDIKKIIAFSTTSQLGLMLTTIGLNEPNLAFFHMLTHAFFKAMLFLCSGVIIHATANEQDIRKFGAAQKTLPITATCMTIGNLALMGTPFLSGFFSKDAIIEAMTTSNLNAWALYMTALATMLTAVYSTRMIFYTQMFYPRHLTLLSMTEPLMTPTKPLIRLAAGTLIAGAMLTTANINTKPTMLTMPPTAKLLALTLALLGMTLTLQLMHTTTSYKMQKMPLMRFPTQLMFFNTLLHRASTHMLLLTSQNLATHLNDAAWLETTGPKMLATTQTAISSHLSSSHLGVMKTYLSLFILTTATTLFF